MSLKVEVNVQKIENEETELTAHFMPCKIDENGPANVAQYFEPYIVADNNGGNNFISLLRLRSTLIQF